jgi:Fe-S cluster assembly scaffold protein SufB
MVKTSSISHQTQSRPKVFRVAPDRHRKIVISQSGKYLVELTGPGAEAEITGAFLGQQDEKHDVEVIIHHRAPHTRATTTLKGVARDRASIRFLGRIVIDPECGNSNSFLTERILLLSDTARAEAIPELEILTDDVKCSHAASVSKIPEEHIFYLMSRGLPRREAEQLIIDGFLAIAE